MSKTLTEIAQQLKDVDKKVQLIYAFNGGGKTRLSREFKKLVEADSSGDESNDAAEHSELSQKHILYYSAFTEDLFYWDNDLSGDEERKLKIHPNSFTNWVFEEQGQDQNVIANFQHYTNEKLTPHYNEEYTKTENGSEVTVKAFSEVTFSFERGNEELTENIKISKGEESNFIWSIFYTLLDQVINVLNAPEPSDRESEQFDQLEYVFIDDPVSSLDENHLIELAVNLADLIKSSTSNLKFIVSTHNALFYNVLFNELNSKACYMLVKHEDGTFDLNEKHGDSNKSFSYHLYLKQTIEKAIASNDVQRYHFMLLRNLYEKTASFLGYPKWSELLPDDQQTYLNRIIQFTSHSTLSNDAVAEPTAQEKQTVKFLLEHLINNYSYWQQAEQNG